MHSLHLHVTAWLMAAVAKIPIMVATLHNTFAVNEFFSRLNIRTAICVTTAAAAAFVTSPPTPNIYSWTSSDHRLNQKMLIFAYASTYRTQILVHLWHVMSFFASIIPSRASWQLPVFITLLLWLLLLLVLVVWWETGRGRPGRTVFGTTHRWRMPYGGVLRQNVVFLLQIVVRAGGRAMWWYFHKYIFTSCFFVMFYVRLRENKINSTVKKCVLHWWQRVMYNKRSITLNQNGSQWNRARGESNGKLHKYRSN